MMLMRRPQASATGSGLLAPFDRVRYEKNVIDFRKRPEPEISSFANCMISLNIK